MVETTCPDGTREMPAIPSVEHMTGGGSYSGRRATWREAEMLADIEALGDEWIRKVDILVCRHPDVPGSLRLIVWRIAARCFR